MVPSRIRLIVLAAVIVIVAPGLLIAQSAAPQTPPAAQAATPGAMKPGMVLIVARVEIKPGKEMAVEKAEHAMAVLHESKNTGMPRMLAMSAVAGPGETWFLAPLPSYAALDTVMEKFQQIPAPVLAELGQMNEQEGAYLNSGSMMIYRYLDEYSHLASTDVSAYRYMQVMMYRVRPGRTMDYLKGAQLYTDAMKKAMPDARWAMFELVSGGNEGTYLVMIPVKKMAELAPDPQAMKAFGEALSPEARQKLQAGTTETITSISQYLFAFNPAMSSVAPVYAKSDPWWAWKAAGPAKTAPAKAGEEKKKGPVKK